MNEHPEVFAAPQVILPPATMVAVRRFEGAVAMVQEMFPEDLADHEIADMASSQLSSLRAIGERFDKERREITDPLRGVIEKINARYMPAIKACKEAADYVSGLLSSWEVRQRQIAEDASRKAQEAARAERARAEAEAAKQRAQAEAEAAILADEANQLRRSGDTEAAEMLDVEAEAAAVTAQVAAQRQTELSLAPLATAPVPEPPKVNGTSFADHWVAELEGPLNAVKATIAAACAQRPELLGLLEINMPAANRMASALKSAFNVPGMRAVNRPIPKRRGR